MIADSAKGHVKGVIWLLSTVRDRRDSWHQDTFQRKAPLRRPRYSTHGRAICWVLRNTFPSKTIHLSTGTVRRCWTLRASFPIETIHLPTGTVGRCWTPKSTNPRLSEAYAFASSVIGHIAHRRKQRLVLGCAALPPSCSRDGGWGAPATRRARVVPSSNSALPGGLD